MDESVKEIVESFFKKYKTTTFKRGEVLINPNKEPQGVFYLKEGIVKQYTISSGGEEVTINTFKSSSLFPMSWVLNDSSNTFYFEAVDKVVVWNVPKKDALKFLETNSFVLLDLVKRIYRGLDGYFMKMEQLMSGSAHNRLISAFIIYARRFGMQKDNGLVINFKVTEKDLAAETGLSRETVSREIQRLKQKGLITLATNKLIVKDLVELEAELSL